MTYDAEKIRPYTGDEKKTAQIERMFDAVAGNYDLLNHLLSFGLDRSWRKRGVKYLSRRLASSATILDVATGTGDLAIRICKTLKTAHVTGIDLSEKMMEAGRKKAAEAGYTERITFERQDCMRLTYTDNTFDAATAAFGIRNFEDIAQGLREMHRVLKPGGHLVILELSTPGKFPMKQLYRFYSKTVIPLAGRLFSGEKKAYRYLPDSVRAVAQGEAMTGLLARAGFRQTKATTFTGGICSLYTGKKV